MGNGSLQGVKRTGRDVHQTSPSGCEIKERVELCQYFHLGLRGLLWAKFTFTLLLHVSGVPRPIIMSSTTAVAASGFYLRSMVIAGLLVIYLNCMMMQGLTNFKFKKMNKNICFKESN